MRILTLIFLIAQLCTPSNAQPTSSAAPDEILAFADELFAAKDYYNALSNYEAYYENHPNLDVALRIAQIQERLRDYASAEHWYGLVVNAPAENGNSFMPYARFKYAQMLKRNGKYALAKTEFRTFSDESDDENLLEKAINETAGCDLALESKMPENLRIANLGSEINTKYSEYSPVLIGEDELYFTAIRSEEIIVVEQTQTDFYSKAFVSGKIGNQWSTPFPLTENVNAEGFHIGNLCLSDDGNRIYFTRVQLFNSIPVESNLYVSKRGKDGWTYAQPAHGLNGNYLVRQPALGQYFGQKGIFFVSDMDNQGHTDIYFSAMKGGHFAKPRKLSGIINTEDNESTPFYRNGTLYFSSDGRVGFGGKDIYSATWDGKDWSEPVNMGKGFNSSADDMYFSINPAENRGFLVSNREGNSSVHGSTCCNDIWAFSLGETKPEPKTLTEEQKKVLPGASITLIEKSNSASFLDVKPKNGATVKVVNASNLNRNYKTSSASFQINTGEIYKVIIQKAGFIGDTLTVEAFGIIESGTLETELYLTEKVPVLAAEPEPESEPEFETYTINQPIELENIFYEYDKWDISETAAGDLAVVLEIMNKYPEMVIELSSHTDSRGEAVYNQELSQKRAEAAKNWLVSRAVKRNRIIAVGYGESKLRNRCNDGVKCKEEEHQFNRRTEFKIVEGPSSIQIEKIRLRQ